MNLLILEYFSGGGYASRELSSSILSESYGMLRSLISDFKAAGHDVTTFLDSRLKTFNPPNNADKIIAVSTPGEIYARLKELSSSVDAVYVIAPESDQTLEKLVKTVTVSGGNSLNCNAEAIKLVSNKMTNYEAVTSAGLKMPKTALLDMSEKIENVKRLIKNLGYPIVFKPLDGVSCDGLSVVKNNKGIGEAIKKIARTSSHNQFIVQELIEGISSSSCVFSTGKKALAVTLNKQFVTLASPDRESEYYGGAVPFDHELEKEALRVAEKATKIADGLKGYVGVDLTLTDEEVFVMEVNPRLTVSYIGLSRAMNFNPAKSIVEATIKRELPKDIQQNNYVFFSKVKVPLCPQLITETYKMKDVVSPPFPVEGNEVLYSLVATSSKNSKGAQSAFYGVKNRLLKLYEECD